MKLESALLPSMLLSLVTVTMASAADNRAAIVLNGRKDVIFCTITTPDVALFTTQNITVVTSSGNILLTCKYTIPSEFVPSRALRASGFPCSIFTPNGSVDTSNTKFIATPGGQATSQCQVKTADVP